ncbi:AbaA [Streptomyces sp. CNQ-509]|nr:AbaA [Streptomyces sp. CNQ-509]
MKMAHTHGTNDAHRTGAPGGGQVYNGMPARELGTDGWDKPWSGPNGDACVEAKRLADGRVALRQSTADDGPALIYTADEMRAFLAGIKNGDADFLLS